MTEEPLLPEVPPQVPPPAPEPERFPFWGFADVFLLAALSIPCMFLGWGLVRLFLWMLRVHGLPAGAEAVPAMVAGYVLVFSCLAVIFRVQYGRPFWQSLGWVPSGVPLAWNVLAGFGTSFVVVLVALLLRMPPVEGRLVEMMNDRTTLILLAFFGTTAAPLFEELAFRGLLQPLLVRNLGAIAGIGLAAAIFGGLHYSEYGSSWRSAVLIGVSGVAFGIMRHVTGSTKAAVIMHASFNGLSFLSMFAKGLPR